MAKESLEQVLKTNKRAALTVLLAITVYGIYAQIPWYVFIVGCVVWFMALIGITWRTLGSRPEEAVKLVNRGTTSNSTAEEMESARSSVLAIKEEFDRTGATKSIENMLYNAFGDREDCVFDLSVQEDMLMVLEGLGSIIHGETGGGPLIMGLISDMSEMKILEGKSIEEKFAYSMSACIKFAQSDRIVKIDESVYQIKEG